MSRLKDAVYGFAVGDALGVPFEFKPRGSFECNDMIGHGTWNQEAGTWSDDTSMLLATCDSIRECGTIDLEDMMQKFVKWVKFSEYTARGEVFDIGVTTSTAIGNYLSGTPIGECGLTKPFSNGNGSLMRILPLVFVDGIDDATIKAVSALTHANETSMGACCEYVRIAKGLMIGGNVPFVYKKPYTKIDSVKSTGYVLDSLNAALFCVANTKNYKDCVLMAVNLGEDTDTIAALTGGLAGIKYGYDAIPEDWIDKLANKELIDKCLF